MRYYEEFDVYSFPAWCGGKDTLDTVINEGLGEQLSWMIEDMFCESTPSMTELNDFLWFESEYIYRSLGIEYGEEDDKEDEEIEDCDLYSEMDLDDELEDIDLELKSLINK